MQHKAMALWIHKAMALWIDGFIVGCAPDTCHLPRRVR
jgi:hypothetical protein